MKTKSLIAEERMRQIAEMLLGEEAVLDTYYKRGEGFHYEFSSAKGEVHFTDQENYAEVECSYETKVGQIKSIQVSENIFCNHCRYLLYHDGHPGYEELCGKIRHYKFENYEWEELEAYLKAITIIDDLKYSSPSILNPLIQRSEEGIIYTPILEYMKGDRKAVKRLFEIVGYSQEEQNNTYEQASVFFSIATRFLYDDDYQVNLIGRGIINCMIRQLT